MNDNDLYQLVKWLDTQIEEHETRTEHEHPYHAYYRGLVHAYKAVKDKIEELIGSEL